MDNKSEKPPMARTVSLNLDEEPGEGRDDCDKSVNNHHNGRKSDAGLAQREAGAARSRGKSLIKKQLTVQRITRAFKESPRDAAVDRKVKERLDSARKWQKFGYLSVLLILILILIIQIIQLTVKYFEGPTYVETSIVDQSEAIFPAITFCSEKSFKEEVLKEHGFDIPKDYNSNKPKSPRRWSSNQTSVGEEELFKMATNSLEDILYSVYIRYFRANATTGQINIEYKDLDSEHLVESFTEQRHRPFGRCYTLHPEQQILDLGVYYMKIKILQPVKVYIHRHGQFLDLSGRMGHKIYTGDIVQTQINYEDIRMVPQSKGNGEVTCTNSTFDTCMTQALERRMLDEVGCVVPWLLSDEPICTDTESSDKAFKIHWDRVTNQFGDCPNPCESLLVNVGGKNYRESKNQDMGLLYLYFSPRVVLSEEHFLYDFVTLMAEVGGYVGLLLGFSFAHFLKWFNLAFEQTVRTWELNKALKEEEREKRKREEEEQQETNNADAAV